MSYTIVMRTEPTYAEVVPTVVDALSLARALSESADEMITIMSDSGWILTLEELEYLVKN